jgi:hypothetical protein
MSHQIVKQPNGKYSIWSSNVSNFIFTDITHEELLEKRVEILPQEKEMQIQKTIESLELGGKPYAQFTNSYDECLQIIKEVHGADE